MKNYPRESADLCTLLFELLKQISPAFKEMLSFKRDAYFLKVICCFNSYSNLQTAGEPCISAVNGQRLPYQAGCIWITNLNKKQVNLQATVYIDSVLNMHSEDLLSCGDRSVKLDYGTKRRFILLPPLPIPSLSTLRSTIKIIHHCGT